MSDKEEVSNTLVPENSVNTPTSLKWRDAYPQIIASLCSYVIVIQAGVILAYSAVLLPQLKEETSDLKVTTDEESWIASLVTLSLPFGALSLGPLMDKFGRKKVCAVTAIPFIISWILVATSKGVAQLYVARFLAGAGGGLSMVTLVYVSEITHPAFRPMLLGLNSVSVSMGILITCALGVWCTWRTMAIVFCVISVLSLLLTFPLPESPHWLVTFCKDEVVPLEELTKSMRWLYRNPVIHKEQLNEILNSRPKMSPPSFSSSSNIGRFSKVVKLYTQPAVYKPTALLALLFLIQQFSGGYVLIFYALDVFRSVGSDFGKFFNEYTALVLIGVIRLIMSVAASLISKKVGRKPLLYISGLGMAISLVAAVIELTISRLVNILPLILILVYVTFASFGFFIVPWNLIGEILPVKVRATMGGIMISWAYLCMFAVVKMFPFVLAAVGMNVMLMFFAAVSFVAVCFVYLSLPETFGKSFREIEDFFVKTREESESEPYL